MKTKIALFFVGIIGIASFLLYNFDREDSSVQRLSITSQDFHRFPQVFSVLSKSLMDDTEYSNKINELNLSSEEHYEIGEHYYNLAYGRAFYGEEKVALLKIAKIHLLQSKTVKGNK